MTKAILFNFVVDKEARTIRVERAFNAPLHLVWAAWTQPEILDQWWAPKPWRAETKTMQFTEGGHWHYCMVGPEGDRQWCLFEFQQIDPEKLFSGLDAFCDEQAVADNTKPRMHWQNAFSGDGESTTVNINLRFDDLSDLETILQMGFREGFTMGLENLDEYLQSQVRSGVVEK
ncbi:MAG TPA: SRPBCC domain-containing protein [Flavisolibacter sp.]|jgi:PhnB protein|nr:SRPBCC domain-containing protein [Flavisolibacter sp.]